MWFTALTIAWLLAYHSDNVHAIEEQPNFVVIMADDLGYGDIGCYGNQRIKTPHIDALAAGGIRFTDFHSSGPVCSPTRAGLTTGRYQQRAGIPAVVSVNHRHIGMSVEEVTFADVLRSAGYATAIFGKWHLGYETKYNPIHQGFDHFRGYISGNVDFFSHVDQAGHYDWWDGDKQIKEEGYVTHLITKHAVKFIEQHKDKPFCLYLPHEAPHYPYQGPNDKPLRTVGGKFNTQGERKDIANAYKEMVEAMDDGVGQVMETLRRLDLEKKTMVLFFSDNGANNRGSNDSLPTSDLSVEPDQQRSLRGFKGSVWEGGHRVPAVAYWPDRILAGKQCDALTITLDVFPTLLSVAGVKPPSNLKVDGRDLSPLLFLGNNSPSNCDAVPARRSSRNNTNWKDRILFWGYKKLRAMRDVSWKLVVLNANSQTKNNKKTPKPALFNLAKDLGEKNDLSKMYPQRVKEMVAAIEKWDKEVGPSEFASP